MSSKLIYYVYAYLRSKDSATAMAGTPYYIGKGSKERVYKQHRVGNKGVYVPKDKLMIIFIERELTEIGALALERRLIRWYGRKDVGTGILHNRTDGGEGVSGRIMSIETRDKISLAKKGIPKTQEYKANMSKVKKGCKGPNKGKSTWSKGIPQTEEHKAKRSLSMSGKKQSAEHIAKRIAAIKRSKQLTP